MTEHFHVDPSVIVPRGPASYAETDADIEMIADVIGEQQGQADSTVDGFTVVADHENLSLFIHYSTMDDAHVNTRKVRD